MWNSLRYRMGCFFSSFNLFSLFSPRAPAAPTIEEPKVYSWDVRKQIDPKDFTIENKNGETIVRMPGSINGMQFIIQNLENCNVYLFDHIALVSIDDCKNCKFFIGPSKGSVFIRDCSDCVLSVLCQQFRTRDCKRISTFLLCSTQPIIESSTQMKFGCISINYNSFEDHMKESKISPFINNWNNIHDFTPVPGEANHSFLNKDYKMEDFLPLPDETIKKQLNLSFEKKASLIPYTIGTIFRPYEQSCLVVLFVSDSSKEAIAKQETDAKKLISIFKEKNPEIVLVQTKQYKFSELSVDSVFGTDKYNALIQKGPIIGLEFNGPNCNHLCESFVNLLQIRPVFVSQQSSSIQRQLDNFYNFAEMQMSV